MNKLHCIFFLLYFSFAPPLWAQTKSGKVSGTVNSLDGPAMNGATVSLLRSKDSMLIKAAVTNQSGNFEIDNIANGKYLIKVTAVGFTANTTAQIEVSDANHTITLPAISLKTDTKQLANVQVVARRPLIENKIDRLVVNVDAAISNAGSTAMEVLEKSPGVMVDKDGNISLKGKQGVRVFIDGKPSNLSAEDLATLLRNTPANQLDQIEIMSQPSSKFDAAGNSGVINIKTKKLVLQGFNGSVSVSYSQGVYPKTNNSISINSRKGKVNLFGTGAISYNRNFNEFELVRNFRDKNTAALTSKFDQHSFIRSFNQPNSFKGGIDFFASKKTTLGMVVNAGYIKGKGDGSSTSNIYNGNSKLDSLNTATTIYNYDWYNYSGNINFRQVIDTSGKEITADIDYITYKKTNPSDNFNYTYDPNHNIIGTPYLLRGRLPSNIYISTAKVDYVHPLKNKVKIETGVKTSIVETDNDAQYTFLDAPSNTWKVDRKTNHFKYSENINAAYVQAGRQWKKWGMQFGLRFENTVAKGRQLTNNQTFKRNYNQLFPTAYFSYAQDQNNNFVLSYGRRIDRPNYQDMNPFQYFLDQYTYREGNPFLQPQLTHNIELSHNYKGQLNTSLNYTLTTDVINDIFIQNDSTRTTAYTKQNIATRRNIGLSLNYNKAINKIWNFSFFGNVYNNYFNGVINKAPLNVNYTTFQFTTSNQFRFNKGWSAELSGMYNYKTLQTTSVGQPMGMISLGAAKQLMKNKATLRLSIRDPFKTMFYNSITKFDNIDMKTIVKWDNRQAAISFTYRFGKNTNNVPQRKKTSASQEEQNRVGQGN